MNSNHVCALLISVTFLLASIFSLLIVAILAFVGVESLFIWFLGMTGVTWVALYLLIVLYDN